MGGEVYADLLFLVNFSMDFLCAYLTASCLRRRVVPWRLILASAVGGVYAVLALFLYLPHGGVLLLDLAICVVMCAILFGERGVPIRFFAWACGAYVGISMAMGGMMTALFRLLNRAGLPLEALAEEQDGISAWLFAILAGVSTLAGLRGGQLLRRSAARRFARLSVTVGSNTVEVQALVDSGNLCRDPISGRPVVFLEAARAADLLGGGRDAAEAVSADVPAAFGSAAAACRIRLIPVETVGGRRLQAAYLPDRMTLSDSGGTHEVRALFAPAETLRAAGVYQAIVPSELVS